MSYLDYEADEQMAEMREQLQAERSPGISEFKVRTRQKTRTLTSGIKLASKWYILMYRVEGQGWYEYPSPFNERAQAVSFGRAMVRGEMTP